MYVSIHILNIIKKTFSQKKIKETTYYAQYSISKRKIFLFKKQDISVPPNIIFFCIHNFLYNKRTLFYAEWKYDLRENFEIRLF